MYKSLKELKEFKEKLGKLAEQLIDKYESFTIEHCGECKKGVEDHTQREKMYCEQIKLAKREDGGVRSIAHLKELDTC